MGTAEAGHYYAFIQDRNRSEKDWFEFNDTLVTPFDTSKLPDEAYGGEEEAYTSYYSNARTMQ